MYVKSVGWEQQTAPVTFTTFNTCNHWYMKLAVDYVLSVKRSVRRTGEQLHRGPLLETGQFPCSPPDQVASPLARTSTRTPPVRPFLVNPTPLLLSINTTMLFISLECLTVSRCLSLSMGGRHVGFFQSLIACTVGLGCNEFRPGSSRLCSAQSASLSLCLPRSRSLPVWKNLLYLGEEAPETKHKCSASVFFPISAACSAGALSAQLFLKPTVLLLFGDLGLRIVFEQQLFCGLHVSGFLFCLYG